MKSSAYAKSLILLVTMFLLLITVGIVASSRSPQRKPELPKGSWSFSAHPYLGADLEERPVIVTSVETAADRGIRLTRVTIKNRSSKPVTAIRLKWELSYEQSREIALSSGTSDWFDLPRILSAGDKVTLRFVGQPLSFAAMSGALVKNGGLDGDFHSIVAVSEVRYEDGSSWIVRRMGSGYLISASMKYKPVQAGCAKQKCKNLGGSGYTCEGSSDSEYCTNRQTTCANTLCGEKPGGDEFEFEW
ncbi:MAG: hypothetical protein U0Z53_22060 [Blastocatellia bacterium]